jgi:hypothetical protein
MGSYRRDRHTASRNSRSFGSSEPHSTGWQAGSIRSLSPYGPSSTDLQLPKESPSALRRSATLPDPALRCGENSRPGKVRHRLEDSREAILWFHDTRLSSNFGHVFGTSVANKGNRVAKFLALASDARAVFDKDVASVNFLDRRSRPRRYSVRRISDRQDNRCSKPPVSGWRVFRQLENERCPATL